MPSPNLITLVVEVSKRKEEEMYTKEDLKKDLEKMGLLKTDTVMVHSSMKAIGQVEGGVDTVVEVFMEYLQEGLFLTPAHTWAQMSETYSVFDPKTEPACVGLIPNTFLKKEGVVRSLHPTHSIAAYGKQAAEYVQGEENATTPCPPGGCWDRLRTVNGKILLLGVTHTRNTYIHSVDEALGIGNRLTSETTLMQIVMPDGSLKGVQMHRHSDSFSDHYDKLMQAFYELGAAKPVKFGDADCILCDAAGVFEVCAKIFSRDADAILQREEISQEWWKK